jgi:hypothetical protein
MALSGQLHAPSALSPVATEQGGCVSLTADLNTLEETKKKISCPCLESNYDSSVVNATDTALPGILTHKTTHFVLHSTSPILHSRDGTIFTLTYRQYIYTLTKESGICRQRCFKTRQASINDNPSVPLQLYLNARHHGHTHEHTPTENEHQLKPQFHSFQREITLCRVS